MADIMDAEAIRFCNEKVRVAADFLAKAYYFAKMVDAEYDANPSLATNLVDADNVVDGSDTDGRHPITGAQAKLVVTRCEELITDMEANTFAKLNSILAVAVNLLP